MDLETIVKGLSEITYVPITKLYNKADNSIQIEYSYPSLPFLQTLVLNLPENLIHNRHQTKIVVFKEFLYYGFVHISETEFYLVGPLVELPIDNIVAQNILKALNLPITQISNLIEYYEGTPHYSLYKFAQILIFLNNIVNNKPITSADVLPDEYQRSIRESVLVPHSRKSLTEEHLNSAVKNQDYELELYSYVLAGRYEKIKELVQQTHFTEETGHLSDSKMRQNKYLVITSIALASRAATRGGVTYNTAMQQADFYYKKVDEANSFNELWDIHKQMLLTFTKLVADRKLGIPTPPHFLPKVQQYIETHLTEKITTADIAQELKINRSYLSTQFKKELGTDLNDYINLLKIEEAKRLLLTTDMPLITIATTLAFSSQSHFAAVFKRVEGVTPTEFQKNTLPR